MFEPPLRIGLYIVVYGLEGKEHVLEICKQSRAREACYMYSSCYPLILIILKLILFTLLSIHNSEIMKSLTSLLIGLSVLASQASAHCKTSSLAYKTQ